MGGRGAAFESIGYRTAVHKTESKIKNDAVETAVVFDKSGNVIFQESNGATNYVRFTPEQIRKMKDSTLTHNHPSSSTFSSEDVALLVGSGLRVIRATGKLATYQLEKVSSSNIDATTFADDYRTAKASNKRKTDREYTVIEKKFSNHSISYSEFQSACAELNEKLNRLNSDWLKANARKYGYRYGVSKGR